MSIPFQHLLNSYCILKSILVKQSNESLCNKQTLSTYLKLFSVFHFAFILHPINFLHRYLVSQREFCWCTDSSDCPLLSAVSVSSMRRNCFRTNLVTLQSNQNECHEDEGFSWSFLKQSWRSNGNIKSRSMFYVTQGRQAGGIKLISLFGSSS